MKRVSTILILLSFLIYSFCQGSVEIDTISDDLFYSEIKDSIYVIIHRFPSRCNSMFVLVGENKGVLIDTPNETTGTKSLITWINTTFGDLELIAINTGFHNDNLGGNEYLRSEGIKIYGSSRTAKLITEKSDDLKAIILEMTSKNEDNRYYHGFKDVTFLPPTDTFDIEKGLRLSISGEIFEIYFPGESHTKDNLVVYIANKRILFGGCMILSIPQQRPGYIEDANMIEWPKSVMIVKNKYNDAEIVIPGHGDWGNIDLLSHTIDVLNRWNTENISR